MQRVLIPILMLMAGAFTAVAGFAPAVSEHEASAGLLEQKSIQLSAEGTVDLSFEEASSILCRSDMLTAIQQAYAEILPEGEQPEFTVRQVAEGKYFYKNRHGEETRIEEVARVRVPGEKVTVALYSEGRRFFGPYQSLCQVEVVPDGENRVHYTIIVHARPESAAIRFFARLAPVELFFRHKTRELTGLVVDVCRQICNEQKGEHYVACSF